MSDSSFTHSSSIYNICSTHIPSFFPLSLDQYTEEQKEALVDCCPTQVFDYDENTKTVSVKNPSACIFCKECLFTTEDFRKNPEDKLAVQVSAVSIFWCLLLFTLCCEEACCLLLTCHI